MVTTNLPDGITNAGNGSAMATLPFPDPTKYFTWMDDFSQYQAGASLPWLATNASGGTAVVQDEVGGVLLVTNAGADNNFYSAQWDGANSANVAEVFKIDLTKDFWFKTRFKLGDATQSDALIGLITTNTDPIAGVVDGIYFLKADDAATLALKLTKNSTTTSFTVGTMVDATYVNAGFHYDPVAGVVEVHLNDVLIGRVSTLTNLIDDEEITPTFTIQNGAGAAKTMSLDYIFAAQPRATP